MTMIWAHYYLIWDTSQFLCTLEFASKRISINLVKKATPGVLVKIFRRNKHKCVHARACTHPHTRTVNEMGKAALTFLSVPIIPLEKND